MIMEAETIITLRNGICIVLFVSAIFFILLWSRTKNISFVWLLLQLIFLGISYYFVEDVLIGNLDISPVMQSEENSLSIGLAGVFWGVSMVCTAVGVYLLTIGGKLKEEN